MTRKGDISKGARVRAAIIKCTEDGAEYNLSDMKEKIAAETGMRYQEDYTEGNFSGAILTLVKKGILIKLERGIYRNSGVKSESNEEMNEETENVEESESIEESAKKNTNDGKTKFDEIYYEYKIMLQKNKEDMEQLMGNIVVMEMKKNDADRLKRMLAYMEHLKRTVKESEDEGANDNE